VNNRKCKIFFIWSIIVILICAWLGYVNAGIFTVPVPDEPYRSFVIIQTEGRANGLFSYVDDKGFHKNILDGNYALSGMGFVTGKNNKYIVTAAHVIKPRIVKTIINDTINDGIFINIITRQIKICFNAEFYVTAEVVYVNEISDVALLVCENNHGFLKSVPYDIILSKMAIAPNISISMLNENGMVAMITRKRDSNGVFTHEWVTRYGSFISDGKPDFIEYEQLNNIMRESFTTNIRVYFGDSGSPVFMQFSTGHIFIVGIIQSLYFKEEYQICGIAGCNGSEISFAVKLDTIFEILVSLGELT
jgi:hypothetical protein